jgi:acetyl esterase/lipase
MTMTRSRIVGSTAALWAVAALIVPAAGQEPKAKAKAAVPPPVPEGVKVERNLDYAGNGLPRQRLDLYRPERAEGPLPLVVWVHGGAWQNGSKEACRAVFLSARGFAVASINYRLTDAAPFPAQIEDCRAAVRWLRANASKYKIDPDRIGVWGGSAGGHLVALLGTAGEETGWDGVGGNSGVSARVQAVCDFFGPADFTAMIEGTNRPFPPDGAIAKLMGGPPREKLDLARKASPVTYASRDDPPFLIVHGDHDTTVPLRQSQTFAERLKQAGVDVTLLVVKNGRHGQWGPDAEPDAQAINETVCSFFEKHLKNPKAKSADTGNGR